MRAWGLVVVVVGVMAAAGCKKKGGDQAAPPAQPAPAKPAPPVLGLKGMPHIAEVPVDRDAVGRGGLPPGWVAGTTAQGGTYAAPQGWNRLDSETHLDEAAPCGELDGCTLFVIRLASADGAGWVEVAARRGDPASAADWVKNATAAASTQDRGGWACGQGTPDNGGDPVSAAACAKLQNDGSLLTEMLQADSKTFNDVGGLVAVTTMVSRTSLWKGPPAVAAPAPDPEPAPENE